MKVGSNKPVDSEVQKSTSSTSSKSEVEEKTSEVGKKSLKDRANDNKYTIGICCILCPPAGAILGCIGLGWLFSQCDCSNAATLCCETTGACIELAVEAAGPTAECCGYACMGCCACVGAFFELCDD